VGVQIIIEDRSATMRERVRRKAVEMGQGTNSEEEGAAPFIRKKWA